MKKITLLLCVALLSSFTALAQYSFPAVAGPTTVVAGSPVTLNINDAANTVGVPAGTYATFSISVDWGNPTGGPWSSEADLTMTTAAGSVSIDPPTSGGANSGTVTTLTFDGAFTADYNPAVDGTLDIVLNQSYGGSGADWSNIVITMVSCAPAAGTTTVVEDCANNQFSIDVNVTDLGNSATVTIANDAGVASTDVTAAGVVTVGPFTAGTPVVITLEHESDTGCNIDLASVLDNCPAQLSVDCAAGTPVNVTYCYDSNEDKQWVFTSTDGSALRVDFVEGYFEDCCDDIIIYDGATTTDTVLFMSDGSENNNATGISAISTGDTMLVRLTSDGSVSCNEGSGTPALNFNVICNSCTPATATSAVVDDCANNQFSVTVDITDLGSATSLTLSDDQGSANQTATAIGMVTFGPYAFGTVVAVTMVDANDAACTQTFSGLTTVTCPPANDDCATPTALTVNSDLSCASVTSGTIAAATASGEDDTACSGTENDDVWFSFVAAATTHTVDLNNVAGSTTDLYHSVWSGTCGALTNLSCSDANSSSVSGLTIGDTYLVRVNSWANASHTTTFDVCIGTNPPPPAQDVCSGAIPITVGSGTCGAMATATNAGATDSSLDTPAPPTASCTAYAGGDIWFSAVVPASGNITISGAASPDCCSYLWYEVYSGADCSALTSVMCSSTTGNDPSLFEMALTGRTPGETLWIRAWDSSNDNGPGDFNMCAYEPAPPAPANDDCGNAEALTLGTPATQVDTTNATDSGIAAASCGATGGDQDVWFSFVGPATGQIAIATDADTVVVYDGCTGTELACGGNGLEVLATTGTTYYARVYNTGVAKVAGPFTLTISETTLSTADFDSALGFSYYPNPVNNTLTLNAQQAITNVAVFNMLGQEVIRTAPNAVSNDVDMSNLQSGAYFVQVTIGQAVETVRVIKN